VVLCARRSPQPLLPAAPVATSDAPAASSLARTISGNGRGGTGTLLTETLICFVSPCVRFRTHLGLGFVFPPHSLGMRRAPLRGARAAPLPSPDVGAAREATSLSTCSIAQTRRFTPSLMTRRAVSCGATSPIRGYCTLKFLGRTYRRISFCPSTNSATACWTNTKSAVPVRSG